MPGRPNVNAPSRHLARLVLTTLAALAWAAGAAAQTPPPITFHNNTMADFSATSGEPIVKVDRRDRIFVTTPFGVSTTLSLLWRSSDGGRSYVPLGAPITRDAVAGPGGGDTDVDFDDEGRVYYIDLSAACVTVAVSEDGGDTFPADRTSYVSCVSEKTMGAIDDRQWIAGFGDGRAYATWRRFTGLAPLPFFMFKTSDGGRTWDAGRELGTVTQSGPLRADKQKRRVTVNGQERDAILVYQIYYNGNNIRLFRITDLDDGTEPLVEDFSIYDGGADDVSFVFPVLAVDRAGNLYAAWSQKGEAVYLATSTDRGRTWSPRKRVSTLAGTNIMPWVVAGDPGRVAVAWYRSPLAGNPNTPASAWTIHMAQSLNAFDAAPSFETVQVSQNVVHRGEICTDGTLCDATGRDRSFLEYPSIDIDSQGAAVVVYNDNTNQSEGPYVMLAKQATGPSLLASVGALGAEPGAVTIGAPGASAPVTTEALTVEGTHTVPPKNYDRDEAGDARFRPTGANLPGADLRAVSLREEGDSLAVTMQVADLSAAAVDAAAAASLGDGLLYLTQWDYDDTVYWLGAEVRAGQTRFYTGTLGMIRSATSKKFITYNPDLLKSQEVRGEMTRAAPGSITLRVPKSLVGSPPAGAQFHSLTAYALSERGPLLPVGASGLPNAGSPAPGTQSLVANPTSLPVQLDASGAVTYTAGAAGPAADGVVEVSLDDPSFAGARAAAFSDDLGESRWRAALTAAELTPGAHTVYARQRVNGRTPSPVASVTFHVSENVERLLTSLTALETRNASLAGGVASYDLLVRNTSGGSIFTPLRAQVVSLSSASGGVTVANADNGLPGAGAAFGFDQLVGGDHALAAGELSGARRLRFNNPSGEAFSVVFDVYGSLPRGSSAVDGGGSSAQPGAAGGAGTSGAGTSGAGVAGSLVRASYKVTYNPLLNRVTVELVRP